MTNPFLDLADSQISGPRKSVLKGVDTRARNRSARAAAAEKELIEEGKLQTLYRRYRREKLQELLDSPQGKDVAGLVKFMKTMTLSSAPALIRMVEVGCERGGWIGQMSRDARFQLLMVIARAVTRLREREKLPPFDDALPGEDPKAVEQVKKLIEVR